MLVRSGRQLFRARRQQAKRDPFQAGIAIKRSSGYQQSVLSYLFWAVILCCRNTEMCLWPAPPCPHAAWHRRFRTRMRLFVQTAYIICSWRAPETRLQLSGRPRCSAVVCQNHALCGCHPGLLFSLFDFPTVDVLINILTALNSIGAKRCNIKIVMIARA